MGCYTAKQVVRYVKGTLDYGIMYSHSQNCKLHRYFDSDWVSCTDDMRSISGYCFPLVLESFLGVLKSKKL